jgi:transposase
MLGLSANLRYFLCTKEVDMRNGFDGLAGIVRNHLKKDPISGDVFIFINKPRTHIKVLYWDGDGFALFYKRLERGRFARTASSDIAQSLRREELMMLLEGLQYGKMRKLKRYYHV